nr:MAG TPA: hypothetical protein [Caudoviricetes sp.]
MSMPRSCNSFKSSLALFTLCLLCDIIVFARTIS